MVQRSPVSQNAQSEQLTSTSSKQSSFPTAQLTVQVPRSSRLYPLLETIVDHITQRFEVCESRIPCRSIPFGELFTFAPHNLKEVASSDLIRDPHVLQPTNTLQHKISFDLDSKKFSDISLRIEITYFTGHEPFTVWYIDVFHKLSSSQLSDIPLLFHELPIARSDFATTVYAFTTLKERGILTKNALSYLSIPTIDSLPYDPFECFREVAKLRQSSKSIRLLPPSASLTNVSSSGLLSETFYVPQGQLVFLPTDHSRFNALYTSAGYSCTIFGFFAKEKKSKNPSFIGLAHFDTRVQHEHIKRIFDALRSDYTFTFYVVSGGVCTILPVFDALKKAGVKHEDFAVFDPDLDGRRVDAALITKDGFFYGTHSILESTKPRGLTQKDLPYTLLWLDESHASNFDSSRIGKSF